VIKIKRSIRYGAKFHVVGKSGEKWRVENWWPTSCPLLSTFLANFCLKHLHFPSFWVYYYIVNKKRREKEWEMGLTIAKI
jgi:hypothetical protein